MNRFRRYINQRASHFCLAIAAVVAVGMMGNSVVKAQGVESTPLTRLGYGSLAETSPVSWRGMGGVGIAMSSAKVINLQNPAAYGATDSLSFVMDIAASINWGHNKDGINRHNALMGGLDYLALQFPIYKDRVAVSTGIVPLSNVGYSLVNDVTIAGRENANIIRQSFSGQGSLQSFYLGVGARVYRGLYAGANVKYHFGKLTHTVHLMPNAQVLSQDYQSYTIRLDNWGVDVGLQYKFHLPTKAQDELTLGLTYSPRMRFTPELFSYSNTNFGSKNKPNITNNLVRAASSLPHKVGVGLAWDMPKKMTLAADFETQLWGDQAINNPFKNDQVTFKNSYRGAIGVQVTPNTYSRRYHERMYYRGGINYRSSYLSIPSVGQVQTVGASFGLGMPVTMFGSDRTSLINLTLEYSHDFSTLQKSFSQDMLKLSLSLNFNETWFRKLKIY
ncbi:hypothetical protein [Porphyromonas somerae]|uniref:hypothetical protein n=1 Tax=Porphyromonas somerae TaxID=322095 RepID=UPI001FCC3336|nr:hypothetical protein [Porphyromonas somerae]